MLLSKKRTVSQTDFAVEEFSAHTHFEAKRSKPIKRVPLRNVTNGSVFRTSNAVLRFGCIVIANHRINDHRPTSISASNITKNLLGQGGSLEWPSFHEINLMKKKGLPRTREELFSIDWDISDDFLVIAGNSSVENEVVDFDRLSAELVTAIFLQLKIPWKEMVKLKCVCRRWCELIERQEHTLRVGRTVFVNSHILDNMLCNESKHQKQILDYILLGKHPDINVEMRTILIDWMVELCDEFLLQNDTLFLAVCYIDRYLSGENVMVSRGRLQLLGLVALFIACKYDDTSIPPVNQLIYYSDNAYTKEEIIAMEVSVLNTLRFDIACFTTKQFVLRILEKLRTNSKTVAQDSSLELDGDRFEMLLQLCNYLSEITLLEYQFILQLPSTIAEAVVCIASNSLGYHFQTMLLKQKSRRFLKDFRICADLLYKSAVLNSKIRSCATYLKYSQSAFMSVALHPILPLNDNL